MTAKSMTTKTGIANDESGAIMIMGVFMATLLVGMVYYVIGIGDVLLFRETMQDAADATAFASAVTHARGMNYVAMINIVMAVVVAVLIMLRVLQYVLLGLKVLAFGLCRVPNPTSPVACIAHPLLKVAHEGMKRAADFYQNSVADPVLKALHKVSGCIAGDDCLGSSRVGIMPLAAQLRAVSMGTGGGPYQPTTAVTFAYPLAGTLPVQNGEFTVTCDRASALTVALLIGNPRAAADPTIANSGGAPLMRFLRGGLEKIAKAAAGSYCKGSPMDPIELDSLRRYPTDSRGLADACYPREGEQDLNACRDHDAWLDDKLRDIQQTHGSADFPDSAIVLADGAATECRTDVSSVKYVQRDYDVQQSWTSRGGFWHLDTDASGALGIGRSFNAMNAQTVTLETAGIGADAPVSFSLESAERLPCGQDGFSPPNFSVPAGRGHQQLYNSICFRASHPRAEDCPGDHEPTNNTDCAGVPERDNMQLVYRFRVRVVQDIVECTRPYVVKIQPQIAQSSTAGPDKAPKRMNPCFLQLGEERYQIRGFAIADRDRIHALLGRDHAATSIPLWGRDASSGVVDGLTTFSREAGMFSVAQAEYYYQVPPNPDTPWVPPTAPEQWLWHMYWTARIRRFHWSEPTPAAPRNSQCSSNSNGSSGGSSTGTSNTGTGGATSAACSNSANNNANCARSSDSNVGMLDSLIVH